jgi:arabinose-5-phosphate isomerase
MDEVLLGKTVQEVMHRRPQVVAAAALAVDALGIMNRFAITSLFVIEDGDRPVGFLHMHDCLRAGVA